MKSFLLVALSAASLLGCTGSLRHSNREPRMDVTIVNHSSHLLEQAVARFGDNDCGFGYVVVGGNKGWVGFQYPITARAELRWYENNAPRVETVDLSQIYRPGREGELIFSVYDGRVDAAFREASVTDTK